MSKEIHSFTCRARLHNHILSVVQRRTALEQMGGPRHPLYTIVVQCLSDSPDQRPTSRDLVRRMEETCNQFSIPHKNVMELHRDMECSVKVI